MKRINKEAFIQSKMLFDEYVKQVSEELIKPHICACCKDSIITLRDSLGFKPSEQHKAFWNNGAVDLISFGYGSANDMRSFHVAICDTCIVELEKSGLAVDIKTTISGEKERGL